MIDKKMKEWIDDASYEDLLYRWRFAPIGDPIFLGETGKHYDKVMSKKRNENPDEHIAASKRIGWKK